MYHIIKQYTRSLALVLLLGAGLAFTSTPAVGQVDISPGIRVGLNAATMGGDAQALGAAFTSLASDGSTNPSTTDGSSIGRSGIMIEAFADVDFGAPVVAQSGLRWIQKGYAIEYTGLLGTKLTNTVKLSYIEIPILAKYPLPTKIAGFRPHLFAGPTVGFNLGAESEFGLKQDIGGLTESSQDLKSIDELDGKSAIGGTDFGLEFGVGASYTLRGLGTASADIRYGLGLANVLNTDAFPSNSDFSGYSLTNQVLSITFGFSL